VKTFPVKQELLDGLERAYLAVKNHPYRVSRIGNRKAYSDCFYDMAKAFDNVLRKFFNKKKRLDSPKNLGWFMHQLFTIALDLAYTHVTEEKHSQYIVWAECYIHQIHKFLDNREFTEYFTHYHKDKYLKHYIYFEDTACFEIADEHLDEYIQKYEEYVKQYDKDDKWNKHMKDSFQKSLDRLRYRKRILDS